MRSATEHSLPLSELPGRQWPLTPCLTTKPIIISLFSLAALQLDISKKPIARMTRLCKCSVEQVPIFYSAKGPASPNCFGLTSRNLLHHRSKQAPVLQSQLGQGSFHNKKRHFILRLLQGMAKAREQLFDYYDMRVIFLLGR